MRGKINGKLAGYSRAVLADGHLKSSAAGCLIVGQLTDMKAFTNSRSIIRLRRAMQDLANIGLIDVIQDWIGNYETEIIAEAIAIERRNSKWQCGQNTK